MNCVYQENGYNSREHYLACIAEDFGLPEHTVIMLANLYGPNEDFDGLVAGLEDMASDFL